ncbi:MAG: DNA/RNA non-specific endonuclease [Sphingobacteriaceae bacterium]|nr:DNA/RNA non-specific endonuclease [Sphingobacteriaceae bacterium]
MRKLVLGFLFFSCVSFSQTYSLNKVTATNANEISFVKHAFYEIGFNTKYKLPAWTFYSLTKEHLALANLERKGSFVKDPLLDSPQAKSNDYSASGFDKGHLVPCEDMSFSEQAMHETFDYSNCAPQTTELNRGEWKMLEELSRNWGKEYGEVIIVSGPVFEINLSKLGEGKIPIPNLFYKIIIRHQEQTYKAISFILPNVSTPINGLQNYVCTIDSVEKITNLDFFSELPDNLEEQFESVINTKDWNFKHHVSSSVVENQHKSENDSVKTKTVSVQCAAKTKKGKRCKKMTTAANGLCPLHD